MIRGIVWWLVCGLIAGWAAGKIMKGEGYGTVADILLGIAGAVVGGFLLSLVGIGGSGGMISTILVAIVGACVLVWLVRKLKKA